MKKETLDQRVSRVISEKELTVSEKHEIDNGSVWAENEWGLILKAKCGFTTLVEKNQFDGFCTVEFSSDIEPSSLYSASSKDIFQNQLSLPIPSKVFVDIGFELISSEFKPVWGQGDGSWEHFVVKKGNVEIESQNNNQNNFTIKLCAVSQ